MPDISLIPKSYKEKEINIASILSRMGIFVIILIIISVLAYGALLFYRKSLDIQLQEVQNQVEEINKQRDENFEKEVLSLERVLKNLKVILKNHFYWSSLFSKIENLSLLQVNFLDFKGMLNEDDSVALILSGRVPGYTYLAKQMVAFGQDELVSDVKVSEITLGTQGGINFTLNINFLKDALLK